MGRASRLADKEYGYVLVPVSEAEGGSFETAVSVVRAYAEQDEEFREGLSSLVSEEARMGAPVDPADWPEPLRRVLVLPDDALPMQRVVAERMVATVARTLVDRWERMYGLLRAYREREGHANVPRQHLEGDELLGSWLSQQRAAFKAGRLPSARAQRLEALGVAWDVLADKWERMYGLLCAFYEREGHANVPKRHKEEGEGLGQWLQKQRTRYAARDMSEAERKAKKVSVMSDEEVRRLEALGVVWDVTAEQWERMYGLLRAYRKREGHANVPAQHKEEGEVLGVWLRTQRKRYAARDMREAERKAKKMGAMSDEEVRRMEAVGVVWRPRG